MTNEDLKRFYGKTSETNSTPDGFVRRTEDGDIPQIPEILESLRSLGSIGRYLSIWDCTTGLPETDPMELPYSYKTGDYFVVSKVGETNYMPNGSSYDGTASTTVDTSTVAVADMYRYDGTAWERLDFHLAVESKLDANKVTHETWTFTLEDDSTVTKEVVLWTSQQ